MIIKGNEAKQKLLEGINETADVVKSTLGAKGRTVMIADPYRMGFNVTKDGVSVAKAVKFDDEILNLGSDFVKNAAMKTLDEAGDGPQPLYSNVLTPKGFVKISSLKEGDKICGTNGSIQKVIGVFNKGLKEIYNVVFSDGRVVECSGNHLWSIIKKSGKKEILTTNNLILNKFKVKSSDGSNIYNYYIPIHEVNFTKKKISLDPYLLGVLIGDGSLSGTGDIEISLGLNKEHIIKKLILPDGLFLNIKYIDNKNYFRIKIKGRTLDNKSIYTLIDELGLLGCLSGTKFIPKNYLYNTIDIRKKLFQGLMDTDGYLNNKGLYEFSTTSDSLIEDVKELFRSLGKSIHYRLHNRSKDINSYSDKSIHRLNELKGYKYGNKIVDIYPTGKYTDMMCIKVSNEDSLYFTDDYILTHNTTSTSVLVQSMCNDIFKEISLGRTVGEVTKELLNDLEEVYNFISTNSKKVESVKDIENIATVSSNNDKEIGKLFSDVYSEAGMGVNIEVIEDDDIDTTFEIVNGFTIIMIKIELNMKIQKFIFIMVR